MPRIHLSVTLELPEEFVALCEYDMVSPAVVLREFIADLCSISRLGSSPNNSYLRNAHEDCDRARAYYEAIHGWKAEWMRQNLPEYVRRRQSSE